MGESDIELVTQVNHSHATVDESSIITCIYTIYYGFIERAERPCRRKTLTNIDHKTYTKLKEFFIYARRFTTMFIEILSANPPCTSGLTRGLPKNKHTHSIEFFTNKFRNSRPTLKYFGQRRIFRLDTPFTWTNRTDPPVGIRIFISRFVCKE